MSQEWMMWTCFRASDVRAEGPGPCGAIWGSEFDNYAEQCGHGHIPFAAVKECVLACVCVTHIAYVCRSSSIFIEIPRNLVGEQQPIKITAICMHKPEPIYPGSLLKVQGFNMQCVWARLWVSIDYARQRGDSQTKLHKTSHCTQTPESRNPKPLFIYPGRRINWVLN